MKAQIYLLITIVLAILLLSCGPLNDATPSSESGSSGTIGFSLAQGANTLSLTNALVYSTNTYVLTITNSSSQFINSNFYSISYSPEDALTKVNQTSNTLSFRVANAASGSVKLTATHSNNNTLTREVTLNLTKAEYSATEIPIAYSPTNTISINGTYTVSPINIGNLANFFPQYPLSVRVSPTLPASIASDGRVSLTTGASVSTNLVTVTFSSSNYVDYTTNFYVQVHTDAVPRAVLRLSFGTAPLTFGGGSYTVTANLTNSDGSRVAGITEDFRFTATPPDAIVGISSNSTSYTFAVTNASYGSVAINAVHQQRNTLSAGQSFALAKRSYPSGVNPIAYSASNFAVSSPSTPGKISLSSDTRANYYPQGLANLTISRVSGPATYSFNANTGEITFTGGGSYEFQATFISSNYVTYTTPQFTVTVEQLTRFGEVVQGGSIPNLANETDEFTRTVLAPLGVATGGTLVARYATESGAGTENGTSWANAWAATDLRGGINGISDAAANKAYVVLIASGTYKPVATTATATIAQRGVSFAMKNHVAIIGGFAGGGGWERTGTTGTTTFSGDIGTEGSTNDNSYQVFSHNKITLDNGLLYGATITGGNANGVFPHSSGGGMYNNEKSSPRLVNVKFVSNSANSSGGGMRNTLSSPVLTGVEFTGNSARFNGGGMHNSFSSSVLTNVVFTGNSADDGGGVYNSFSSPVLTGVVFIGNSAGGSGGGMLNDTVSSPVLVGAVFRGNSATSGGGMYNNNDNNTAGPLIVNTILAGNSATGSGPDIAMRRDSANGETIRIAGSVLGIGTGNATNGIVDIGTTGPLNLTYHSLKNGAVKFGADASTSATTGGLTYPTIQSTSSAVDIGLYVRKSGTTYYFSESGTGTTWHTNFTATGGLGGTAVALPAGAEDLTATDIAGNARVGRPDAGVHEYK